MKKIIITTLSFISLLLSLSVFASDCKYSGTNSEVNNYDENGDSPLLYEIKSGKVECVKKILNMGANPDLSITNRYYYSPIVAALMWQHEEIALVLVEVSKNLNPEVGSVAIGQTGLRLIHFVTQNFYSKVLLRMLQKGVDVNSTDSRGATPLHYVANNQSRNLFFKEQMDTLEVLLKNKADLNSLGDFVVKKLSSSTTGTLLVGATPFHVAVASNNPKLVQRLINSGAKINQPAKEMRFYNAGPSLLYNTNASPLAIAAHEEQYEVIDVLINAGADYLQRDGFGQTLLNNLAHVQDLNLDRLKFLIANGIDVNSRDKFNYSAIFYYARNNDKFFEHVLELVKAGADVNLQGDNLETPLHRATWNSPRVTKLLIENGARFNAQDMDGETPLFSAGQSLEVFDILLSACADPFIKSKRGETAYEEIKREDNYFSTRESRQTRSLLKQYQSNFKKHCL